MNAPLPSRHEQKVMRLASAQFQTNAGSLEQLARRIDAEVRRGNALLVAVRLNRIMRQVREHP